MGFCQQRDRKKINHGIVKKSMSFEINTEMGIKSTGISNMPTNSIPLTHFPGLLLLLLAGAIASVY